MKTHERRISVHALKQVLMSILVILCLIALVGCGVSKEEHEKAVSELSKTKAELAQAVTKMADMEKSLSEAQAQLKSQAKEPSPAEKPAEVEKPAAVDTGMQDKLAAAQKEASDLRAKVESLTGENANLQSMLEKLKAEYAEIQKKIGAGVPAPTQQLPAGLPKKP
jgi:predicted  nucleic acid-binding Zn-ribbon protein